jgi:hypothetical protein
MAKFKVSTETIVAVLAFAALIFLIYNYSSKKFTSGFGHRISPAGLSGEYSASQYGSLGDAAPVTSSSGRRKAEDDSSLLLPRETNSQFNSEQGSGPFKGINLMKAGSIIGINTIGSTLKNANLQERSEPPNPQMHVSPWNNSTIEPDLLRTPLEVGCGKQ